MDARSLVAWNLRRMRVAKGLPQEALAVDAEVDRTYISRLERNLENPTIAVLERIADALDTEIVAFFEQPAVGAVAPEVMRKGRRRSKALGEKAE